MKHRPDVMHGRGWVSAGCAGMQWYALGSSGQTARGRCDLSTEGSGTLRSREVRRRCMAEIQSGRTSVTWPLAGLRTGLWCVTASRSRVQCKGQDRGSRAAPVSRTLPGCWVLVRQGAGFQLQIGLTHGNGGGCRTGFCSLPPARGREGESARNGNYLRLQGESPQHRPQRNTRPRAHTQAHAQDSNARFPCTWARSCPGQFRTCSSSHSIKKKV